MLKNKIKRNLILLLDCFKSLFFLFLSLFVKRKNNRIVLGSWLGQRFADNSKYLSKYITSLKENYTVFWVGDEAIRGEVESNGLVFLPINKFKTNIILLSCKYFFCTQGIRRDISKINVYFKSKRCYLHHGMPLKRIKADDIQLLNQKKENIFLRLWRGLHRIMECICGEYLQFHFFPTSSEKHEYAYSTSMKEWGYTNSKSIKSGTPRNDYLIENKYNSEYQKNLKKTYFDSLGICNYEKRVILYLPTFRRVSNNIFSFSTLSSNKLKHLNNFLKKNNTIIIEKSHFAEKHRFVTDSLGSVFFVDRNVDVQEMMLFADAVISDYSGAILDFLLLDRPIVHFIYDYDYYKNVDSGLYYNIEDFCAGSLAYTYDELLLHLEELLNKKDCYSDRRRLIRSIYMNYENGIASKMIFETVVLNKK